MQSSGIFYNVERLMPAASHLAASPSPRHGGNVGQAPSQAQFAELTDRGVFHQLSVLLSRYAIAPTGH